MVNNYSYSKADTDAVISTNTTKPVIMLILVSFLILGIILAVVIFCSKTRTTKPEYVEIETKISQYIQNKHLNIRLHSSEYKIFLRGILFGEHPELTNGLNDKELEEIGEYVLEYLEIPREKEEDLPLPPLNTPN